MFCVQGRRLFPGGPDGVFQRCLAASRVPTIASLLLLAESPSSGLFTSKTSVGQQVHGDLLLLL